mmetsp:Transcript_2309/g.5444  ORF Transcript_2309/g.5444 Transcript_2309/m.5444 type:complete len:123 (-) Transcript_2309:1545-1913(-)
MLHRCLSCWSSSFWLPAWCCRGYIVRTLFTGIAGNRFMDFWLQMDVQLGALRTRWCMCSVYSVWRQRNRSAGVPGNYGSTVQAVPDLLNGRISSAAMYKIRRQILCRLQDLHVRRVRGEFLL